MKWINIKNIVLNKLNIITFLPELLNGKPKIWISYALPRWKKNKYNWGDDINPILIEKISSKTVIPYQFSWFKHQHYLCIGSIIQWYSDKNAIIWGSGLLYPTTLIKHPKKVLAVRGPLTRECLLKCGIACPEVYGDPALLFPYFYMPNIQKQYKLGIICHVSELKKLDKTLFNNENCIFINVKEYNRWTDFIDQILSCEMILSSSLHGIIISDAYSIPNLWCQFTNYKAEHEGFKFRDYYLSVNKNIENPYIIDKTTNFNNLEIQIKRSWTKPIIDLNRLMKVCPFKKSIS